MWHYSFMCSHLSLLIQVNTTSPMKSPVRSVSFCLLQPFTTTTQVVLVVKNPTANAGDKRDAALIPGRRESQLTPVFLPGESHGQRSLVGYNPWGSESQTWLKQLSTAAPHNQGQFGYQKSSMNLFLSYSQKLKGKVYLIGRQFSMTLSFYFSCHIAASVLDYFERIFI